MFLFSQALFSQSLPTYSYTGLPMSVISILESITKNLLKQRAQIYDPKALQS